MDLNSSTSASSKWLTLVLMKKSLDSKRNEALRRQMKGKVKTCLEWQMKIGMLTETFQKSNLKKKMKKTRLCLMN